MIVSRGVDLDCDGELLVGVLVPPVCRLFRGFLVVVGGGLVCQMRSGIALTRRRAWFNWVCQGHCSTSRRW